MAARTETQSSSDRFDTAPFLSDPVPSDKETPPDSGFSNLGPLTDSHAARPTRRGRWIGVAIAAVALALFTGFVVAFPSMLGYGSADDSRSASTERVASGRLLVTVTEDGNLESASNVEVRCQVAGGGTIIWIIPDGSMVEEGQELVRLDQSVIEDQLNTQKINYEKALATKIQADQDYAAANISVKEYAEGTYVKDLQSAESLIKIAMENLRTAENSRAHTERMYRKGFVTALQLEADKFAVERAKLDLDAAQTAKKVLQEFTRPKMLKDLEAKRDAADARTRSEKAAVDLEKDKLDRLQNQLKFSVIRAPQRGMVIYANEMGGRRGFSGNQSSTIEEGAVVRDRQTLIRLPDLTRMQVKVTVHESKVEMIRPGMAARITVQDRQWNGRVVSVANQPEPGNWFMSSIKEYATIVSIDGNTAGLKPGMTAQAEILIADLHDVLTLPVSAVVEQNGKFVAWVKGKGKPQRRVLLLGQTNDKVVEVKDGVTKGDEVILNPRAVIADAQQGAVASLDASDMNRFGNLQPGTGADAEKGSSASAPRSAADGKGSAGPGDPAERGGKDGDRSSRRRGDGSRRGGEGGRGEGRRGSGDVARGDGARGDGARGDGARGGQGRRRPEFAELDKNKDGKVTLDETPERMKSFFDTIDANHDGGIDKAEWAETTKRFEAMRRQRADQGAPAAPGGAP